MSRTAFISWAHRDSMMTDEEAISWRDLVRALYERLTDSGIEVRLDVYEQGNVDWTRWGTQMPKECDFTLIVVSKAWCERWEGRNEPHEGTGAVREADTLHGMFQKSQKDFQSRVLIVILPGVTEDVIPEDLYRINHYSVNPQTGEGVKSLLHQLLGKPEFEPLVPGPVAELPPQPRVTTRTSPGRTDRRSPSEVGHFNEITEIKQAAEKAALPPELPLGGSIADWFMALAAWNDRMTTLVDDIELAMALSPHVPSARFVQQRSKTRESIKLIISGLHGPQTTEHATELSKTAARLRGQVARLARLALEP